MYQQNVGSCDKPKSQVGEQVVRLKSLVSSLDNNLKSLYSKMSSVLINQMTEGEPEIACPRPPHSELVLVISDQCDKIEQLIMGVQMMIDRCEL